MQASARDDAAARMRTWLMPTTLSFPTMERMVSFSAGLAVKVRSVPSSRLDFIRLHMPKCALARSTDAAVRQSNSPFPTSRTS